MKDTTSPARLRKTKSRLSETWQQLAAKELSLYAAERAVLGLKDKGLYYMLTPTHVLPKSKLAHIRDYRTQRAIYWGHELLVGLGFQFKEWNSEGGYRVYERLLMEDRDETTGKFILKHKPKVLRIEWGYWETADGVVRHFRYSENGRKHWAMKRDFLLMIVKLRGLG